MSACPACSALNGCFNAVALAMLTFEFGGCRRIFLLSFKNCHQVLCNWRVARMRSEHETREAIAVVVLLALVGKVDANVALRVANDTDGVLTLLNLLVFASQHSAICRNTFVGSPQVFL